MIKLLAKIFIKDYKNYGDNKVREQYGVLCGGFGIFLNILLFALKFIFGTIAASVAMVADAFNNLSDAASSIVQILGFKLSSKKPDSEHPFGHGRLEYISGLIISFFILLMGFELLKSSFESLFNAREVQANMLSIIVMVLAVLIKFYMFLYNRAIAKKINSVTMDANAKDSLGDVVSTSVVIAAVIASKFTSFPVDGIGGIIVGIFILKTGYEAAKETIAPLLGTAPSAEFCKKIEEEALLHQPIYAIHDLIVHDYGPGRLMISFHAEVPGDMDIFKLHDIIDQTEVAIALKYNCHVVIHMDPIDLNNERLAELKVILKNVVAEIDGNLQFHDVRLVPGESHTNLIFDLVVPHDFKLSEMELRQKIWDSIRQKPGCSDICTVITIDKPFINH